ncbi:hypothetical protein, partial [Enterobacter ludwigii]|uniref:hypothetical protein n=1 Tax=Enterobacter ludwigii TaxID=299767 RepID=UPI001CC30E28
WKPPAHSPEENMVRQKCSGIRRSYLVANYVPELAVNKLDANFRKSLITAVAAQNLTLSLR